MRTLQAVAIVTVVLTSAAVGFVAGVALMAAGEPIAPAAAPSPAPPPRWERLI